MNLDYDSLFEDVKSSLQEAKAQNGNYVSYDSMLKLVAPKDGSTPNDYMLRLLPYAKEGKEGYKKTFFHYEKYSWKDEMGNNYSVLSRRTFNEQCPISNYKFNIDRNGTEYEKKTTAERLIWRRGWYCNVLVVNDPVNPANNGQVKVLSLNKTLWDIIDNALKGGLDDEWSELATENDPNGRQIRVNVGRMILDLTDNGINLNVRVGKQGVWPDYKQSRFTRKNAKLGLSQQQQEEILNKCQDVTKIEKELSAEEVMTKFKETYLGEVSQNTVHPGFKPDTQQPTSSFVAPSPIDDEIPDLSSNQNTPSIVDEVSAFANNWLKQSI